MFKIPVIILSGFLGSGKTTLLLQMIKEAKDKKLQPAVLMNELGKNDVDGHILNDIMPELQVEKLLDGCICCSIKSEVTGCIEQLLLQNPDVLFIELTGVANPEEIADSLTEPGLIEHVFLKQIITVLDAENVLDYNSIFATDRELVHTLRRQIEVADLLIVNKTDLIDSPKKVKIEKAIKKKNPESELHYTTHSQIAMEHIFHGLHPISDKIKQAAYKKTKDPVEQKHSHSHNHDHKKSFSRIQTHTLIIEKGQGHNLTLKKLEKFLKKWEPQLLRAKGYLSLGAGEDVYLMQFAAKRANWQRSRYAGQPYIVFIGLELELAHIEREWNELIHQ